MVAFQSLTFSGMVFPIFPLTIIHTLSMHLDLDGDAMVIKTSIGIFGNEGRCQVLLGN